MMCWIGWRNTTLDIMWSPATTIPEIRYGYPQNSTVTRSLDYHPHVELNMRVTKRFAFQRQGESRSAV